MEETPEFSKEGFDDESLVLVLESNKLKENHFQCDISTKECGKSRKSNIRPMGGLQ